MPRSSLNFTGTGVTVTDNVGADRVDVTIPGGISPTIVDVKGDLIAATAADIVARLATGSNGQVLSADSTTSTGLAWASVGSVVTTNTQTASYTLVLTDLGKVVEMNAAGSTNLTIPPNSTVAFPVGSLIEIVRFGAGTVTVVAGAGVTIRSPGGLLALRAQYSTGGLRKRATDEWVLSGDIS